MMTFSGEATPQQRDLLKFMTFGVAFHHASLTVEERDIVETAFRSDGVSLIFSMVRKRPVQISIFIEVYRDFRSVFRSPYSYQFSSGSLGIL